MSIHSLMVRAADLPRPESKRERILRAAIDIFAQSGYFNAKVSEIARAAGVADGTIYLYFDGKEDLLTSIFRDHTRNYLQSLERDVANVSRPEERIRIAIRHHLDTLGRDPSLANGLQTQRELVGSSRHVDRIALSVEEHQRSEGMLHRVGGRCTLGLQGFFRNVLRCEPASGRFLEDADDFER